MGVGGVWPGRSGVVGVGSSYSVPARGPGESKGEGGRRVYDCAGGGAWLRWIWGGGGWDTQGMGEGRSCQTPREGFVWGKGPWGGGL